MKKRKLYIRSAAAMTAGIITMEAFILEYFYKLAIKRGKTASLRTDELYGKEAIEKGIINNAREWIRLIENWIDAEAVTEDNLHVYARVYKNTNSHLWAVIVHGYGASSEDLPDVVRQFMNKEYNVLLPDLRGHGKSEGDAVTFGWLDRLDISAWVRWIAENDKDAKIILYGQSMGASAVMNAASEELGSSVVACVEECGFSSVEKILDYELSEMVPILPRMIRKYLLHKIDFMIKARCGYSIYDGNCAEQLKKCTIPILFIHGTLDRIVPCDMVYDCYYACKAEKELILYEAAHTECCLMSDYYHRVFAFIERFI